MNSPAAQAITIGDRYVAVRYIGKKPLKHDTVLGRKVIWNGHGDVKWVPEKDAAQYIQYADIWEIAYDVEVPTGGIGGLAAAGGVARPPAPSDLHSKEPLPTKLNRAPDSGYETDPKVAAMTDAIAGFAASAAAENLTVEAAVAKLTRLMKACQKLKQEDFDPTGKPKAIALQRVLGGPVSRQERDIAWHLLTKQMEKMHASVPKEGEQSSEPPSDDSESGEEGEPASTDPAAEIP
jgi:hypothetical protein